MIALLSSPIVAFLTDEGHATEFSDGGMLASAAWLIPVVPMVAAVAIVFFGKRLPLKGWELAVGSVGFVAIYGTVLFFANLSEGINYQAAVVVGEIGPFDIEWGWMVDGLSIMMYFVVGVVGTLVFIYAKGYMEGDVRYTWFFASFTLFAGGMLVLVSAPNLIQLIVGWELVGVASWLLIGHYWEQHENSSAAIKAFITNRVADVGLFIGAIIVTLSAGSFRFTEILAGVEEGNATIARFAFWGGLALFIGAMGKSGQFPLHVWLPDAMAGPTPVSSLMHAATMVTAGVYLVARMFPYYLTDGFANDVLTIILIIGGLTLFLTGLIALVQDDIKRLLAYSTLSQLGYMMAAMGAGAYTAGLFHLFTHAFFKALLFLCAGSLIHAVHSNNMSDMGGLRKMMPTTFWTFVVGALALAGILPLAGFWSKDEILASIEFDASHGGGTVAWIVLGLAIVGAFVTAFYMARAIYLTFYGEYKGHGHPHESPNVMTYPLVALAGLSAVAGLINIPGVTEWFTETVGARFVPVLDHHAESIDFLLAGIGLTVAVAGLLVGRAIYSEDAATQAERERLEIPVLYPLLRHKYYIDDFYFYGIIKPIRDPIARAVNWFNGHVIDLAVNGTGYLMAQLARVVYGFDQRGLDAAINAAAGSVGEAGGALRQGQTGRVQQYAGGMFIGAVLIIAGFVIFG